jgi:hypothetical protein
MEAPPENCLKHPSNWQRFWVRKCVPSEKPQLTSTLPPKVDTMHWEICTPVMLPKLAYKANRFSFERLRNKIATNCRFY